MNCIPLKPAALALALGLALALAGAAIAQSKPTPAQQKELDAARAEVERAAERLAELSAKYGDSQAPIRVERRVLRKPVIGVLLAPDDSAGVRIAGVTPDSAALAAGLKSGDRITSIDGKSINAGNGSARVDQARELLAGLDAKTMVKLRYDRDGKVQTVELTPKVSDRLLFMPGLDGEANFDGDVRVFDLGDDDVEVVTNNRRFATAAIAPGVRHEVIRISGDCKDDDCKLPVLAEAFRWNGLNLASVDAGLGRYFGTSDGVLVLSTGKDLDGLQAGDVIRRINGKPVNSPREAMDALRAQPAGVKVGIDYLRDRKAATARVAVPKALPFRIPPPPPMPPMPPVAPGATGGPGAMHMVEKRKMVFVDENGKTHTWEGGAGDTPPAWVAKLAPEATGGKHVEERTMVFVDENGKRTVINGSDVPPPPPPPPPAPKAPKAPPPPPVPPSRN